MTDNTASHDTLIIKRRLAASPARVFRAWSDREERMLWDVPGDDWVIAEAEQDFREDGVERYRFGPVDDPDIESRGRYLVIEPNRRIVSAGTMRGVTSGTVSSATLMTLDFEPDGEGTLLTLTDQSAFLGEGETADMRKSGWETILGKLDRYLTI